MKNFFIGVSVGVGLGYFFHEDIRRALINTIEKADDPVEESS